MENLENDDDFEFVALDTDYDSELAEVCFKIVEYWTEDYPFDELLEELEVLPEEVLYTLVKAGVIDEDKLINYLSTDA